MSYKQKKLDHMLADSKYDGDLHEKYCFSLPFPIIYPMTAAGKRINLIQSPELVLCEHKWQLHLYPSGMEGDSEFIELNVVSLSDKEVFAHYTLHLVNHADGEENIKWSDPDSVVCFSRVEDGDNVWGCVDFVQMTHIEENTEKYVKDGQITFMVDLEVFGRQGMQTHSIAKAIHDAVKTDTLIQMADDDINDIVTKLPKGKNLSNQKKQEDGIISNRTTAGGSAALLTGSRPPGSSSGSMRK